MNDPNKRDLQRIAEIEQKTQMLLEEHLDSLTNFAFNVLVDDCPSQGDIAPTLLIYYSLTRHALLKNQDESKYFRDYVDSCLTQTESMLSSQKKESKET